MSFSVVIPQLFYDLIARVLPGFFFLVLMRINLPGIMGSFLPPRLSGGDNIVDLLGRGIGYIALCYILGWLFRSFTWGSQCEEKRKLHQKENDRKSLNIKYQWIRLSHPPAGFRIVKLRAEARMLETTRTAMFTVVLLTIVGLLASLTPLRLLDLTDPGTALWRPIIGICIALIASYGLHRCEAKAWDSYWVNINCIYEILHDADDPVRSYAGK